MRPGARLTATCYCTSWWMYSTRGNRRLCPYLLGFNSGEIRSLRILAPQPPASAAAYEATIRDRYGDLADEFLQLYPSSNMPESVLATTRDALYGWTAERLVRKQTALRTAVFSVLLGSWLPGRRLCWFACLSRERIALRVRHLRWHAAALAEDSADGRGEEACRTR